MSAEAERWARATAGRGVGVRAVPEGTLVILERLGSRFLAVRHGAFEQLSATLVPRFEDEPAGVRDAVLTSLARAHVFTLGARAGIDRAGNLAVVAEAEAPVADDALAGWLMRTQVVANAMLAIVTVARGTGQPLGHDEVARLFEARQ